MDKVSADLGVIGGSGLYEMDGLSVREDVDLQTPWGTPSDTYRIGEIEGVRVAFLPRHGKGHRRCPHEINYRANIFGFKLLGVTRLISVSAVGSMKESIAPGHIVVPDQFIDRTRRPQSFFGDGIVGHIAFADPVCHEVSDALLRASRQAGLTAHAGGTYLCIEGPQFSTRAESALYRSFGVSVIGMTNLPEARLAREAEICYSTLALVTDYDCWHDSEDDVSVNQVLDVLKKNVANARRIVREALRHLALERSCACGQALENAILTDRQAISEDRYRELRPLIGRLFERVP